MTTLVRLAKRTPGLDVETFQREMQTACDWSTLASFGLRRATQALTLVGGYRRGEPVYDVVDELIFDDELSATAARDSTALSSGGGHELLDGSTIAYLIIEEHVAKPGEPGRGYVKNYEVVTKLPTMGRAEFDSYWKQVHGPLASQIAPIRRYVQAHLAPGQIARGDAPFDGLALTWFDDVAAMRSGAECDVYAATRVDEANFLDGELPFIITTERATYPRP